MPLIITPNERCLLVQVTQDFEVLAPTRLYYRNKPMRLKEWTWSSWGYCKDHIHSFQSAILRHEIHVFHHIYVFGCHYGMIYEHDAARRNQALIFYKVPNDLISSAERFSSLRFGYDANLAYFPKQKKNGKKNRGVLETIWQLNYWKYASTVGYALVLRLPIRFPAVLCFSKNEGFFSRTWTQSQCSFQITSCRYPRARFQLKHVTVTRLRCQAF